MPRGNEASGCEPVSKRNPQESGIFLSTKIPHEPVQKKGVEASGNMMDRDIDWNGDRMTTQSNNTLLTVSSVLVFHQDSSLWFIPALSIRQLTLSKQDQSVALASFEAALPPP